MAAKNKKPREFFDRDYSKREAYSRAWKFIRPYKFRIFVGIFCGMLTAGTLVPLFQIIQPAVSRLEVVGKVESAVNEASKENVDVENSSKEEPETAKAAHKGLPSWYPKVERIAERCGIKLLDEHGALAGPLILLAVFVIPILAGIRLALKFLNSYCLAWAGAHAVADMSCEMLRHVQKQSLQFFGRVNVGQLMSRITGDPQEIRTIIQIIIAELSEAPFEILVSSAFIIWFAIVNNMIPTLLIIVVAFPLFIMVSRLVGKRMQEWTRTSLYRSSAVLSRIHEVLTCVRLVKSSNTEAEECALYREAKTRMTVLREHEYNRSRSRDTIAFLKLAETGCEEQFAAEVSRWLAEARAVLERESYLAAKFYDSKTRTARSAINAYEGFLAEFPDGVYAGEVKRRLDELKNNGGSK
jgi:ABC-type multidrug transport system fused ATPase/permease subunit